MSLIKQHVLSEAALDARRRNGQQSRGAVTPQGREHIRAASLKHGIYSKDRDRALRSLGEDPEKLDELIAGSYEQWRPDNDQQTGLVEQLAHLQWRMGRAARMQERLAAVQINRLEANQREQNDAALDRWAGMEERLELVARHALRPDFYAPPAYIQNYLDAFDDQTFEPAPMILLLLHSLRRPQNLPPAPAPLPDGAPDDNYWHLYIECLEAKSVAASDDAEEEGDGLDEGEGEGDDSEDDVPYPNIPIAEGAERDALRQQLIDTAHEEARRLRAERDKLLNAPLSQAQRDHAVLRVGDSLDRLRREEESCARQLCRLGAFLMKLQERAEARDREVRDTDRENAGQATEARCNTGWSEHPDRESQDRTGDRRDDVQSGENPAAQKHENAGVSGDVIENVA